MQLRHGFISDSFRQIGVDDIRLITEWARANPPVAVNLKRFKPLDLMRLGAGRHGIEPQGS